MIGIGVGIPFNKGIQRAKYLLDKDFAQGATAAYALRLLREKHSGGLVRVRADDSGTDKGEADVLGILQPDDSKIITLNSPIENLNSKAQTRLGVPAGGGDKVLADLVDAGGQNFDGFVSKWYDQSGNGYDASNSTASEQPQIVSDGSVIKENGKPAIKFDGSNDFLNNTNPDLSFNPSYFIFAVSLQSDRAFILGASSDFGNYTILNLRSKSIRFFDGSASNLGNGYNLNQNVIGEINHVGINVEFFQNGNSLGSDNVGTSTGATGITIGSNYKRGNYLDGFYGEIIIFSEDKATKRNNIYNNVDNYWR